jgi:hypothetical protein
MMKKFSIVLFIFALFFSMFPMATNANPLTGSSYSDVPNNHWAKEEIEYLKDSGIIHGYKDGTFRPEHTINRVEAAIMLVRALNLDTANRPDPNFKDIPTTYKFYDDIAAVADENIIKGNNNYFYPNRNLTRAEMAAILSRAYQLTYNNTYNFLDIKSSYWAYDAIQSLADNQITVGYPDKTYRPNVAVTRAQFSVFMARVLEDSFKPQTLVKMKEIRDKWEVYKPTFTDDPFITNASTSSPYRAGVLAEGFLNDGLKMANFARYLAGLPDDLDLTEDLNDLAGHGAVLLAASEFSHTPSKPADMSQQFYEKGYQSTSSSNIGMGNHYSSTPLNEMLSQYVNNFLIDFGTNNLSHVGHRMHILNPDIQKIGFGFATKENYHYIAMQIFDRSRSQYVDYETIAYPTKDYFPLELISNEIPWSITLNDSLYRTPNIDEVQVTLTRNNDKKTWVFNKSHNTISDNGRYFNVNNETIIFRPDNITYKEGDIFTVTITGVKKGGLLSSKNVTITYPVEIIKLK